MYIRILEFNYSLLSCNTNLYFYEVLYKKFVSRNPRFGKAKMKTKLRSHIDIKISGRFKTVYEPFHIRNSTNNHKRSQEISSKIHRILYEFSNQLHM